MSTTGVDKVASGESGHPPTRWVGRRVKRKEDPALLRGHGRYFADLPCPAGTLHLAFVRSTEAHARLVEVDLSEALAMPGVVSGFTAADLGEEVPAMLIDMIRPMLPGNLRVPPSPLLATDTVVFHGEPIAVLLGDDPRLVADAVERVRARYEPLPVVLDAERALEPDAPVLYPDWPDNVIYHEKPVHFGGTTPEQNEELNSQLDEAFVSADIVVRGRFASARSGASPMEARGAMAWWDDYQGLTVWNKNQRPHIMGLALAELLDIPHSRVHVIAPHNQGGGFGCHAPINREDVLVALLARKLRRPVRWLESRVDGFRAGIGQERGMVHYLEVAARADGKLLAVRDRMIADAGSGHTGVYLGVVMPWLGALYLPNAYDLPIVEVELVCAVTNKPPMNPSRSFGEFTSRFAMDSAVDMVAAKLGMEPAQVRRKNLITTFPYMVATGIGYDSGDFLAAHQHAVDVIDLEKFRAEQAELRRQGRYVGVGFAVGAELSGISSYVFVSMENQPGYGAATVKVDPHGSIEVSVGDPPQGQSHETTFSQIVADELGVTPDDVSLHYGDSKTTPFGSGTLANRSAPYSVSAAILACREIRYKAAWLAAHDLEVDAKPEDFDFVDHDIVLRRDPATRVPLARIAHRLLMTPVRLPKGMEPGLEHTSYFDSEFPSLFSGNAHAAVVEVDPETGEYQILRYIAAEDSGLEINPAVVEGQVHGGCALGIANATLEQFVYDDKGVLQSTTLMDYLMPSAADLPSIEHHDVSVPTPFTPLGIKGKGEGIPGPAPAAIANAISDALSPFGVRITELPITAERVWGALQAAPSGSDGTKSAQAGVDASSGGIETA